MLAKMLYSYLLFFYFIKVMKKEVMKRMENNLFT